MSAVYLCLIAVKILECKRYPLVYSGNEFKAKFGLFKREGKLAVSNNVEEAGIISFYTFCLVSSPI